MPQLFDLAFELGDRFFEFEEITMKPPMQHGGPVMNTSSVQPASRLLDQTSRSR
jgi:hypothetical protein